MTDIVSGAATSARAPKQDRSRQTRQKLLEGTIHCLATKGWTASTVSVIAAEAGISRGAAQHHFPTREGLITAALDYMFEQRASRVRQDAATIVDRPDRAEYVVELLVNYYSDPLFKAALQVWTAAAADPELRQQIVPLEAKFARGVHELAVQLLHADDSDSQTHRLIQATLDLARGLGLADVLTDDSARRAKIAKAWARQLSGIKTLP